MFEVGFCMIGLTLCQAIMTLKDSGRSVFEIFWENVKMLVTCMSHFPTMFPVKFGSPYSYADAFNLDMSKIFMCGNGLIASYMYHTTVNRIRI